MCAHVRVYWANKKTGNVSERRWRNHPLRCPNVRLTYPLSSADGTFRALRQGCQEVTDEKNSKVKLRWNERYECQKMIYIIFHIQRTSQKLIYVRGRIPISKDAG